jgi:predicted transposase YdaD
VGLYPFASLAQTDQPELVLREVAAKIEEIPERKLQADISAMSYILAGLVLDRDRVGRIIRRDIMRESVTYQDILAEGEVKGLERGLQLEKLLVVKQLTKKLGNLTPKIQGQVNNLAIDRVESLGEALLDFNSMADLEAWLSQN